MLRAGPGANRSTGQRRKGMTCSLPALRLCSREVQDRMKKTLFVLFLLAAFGVVGRAQESRQDISLSGIGIIEPFVASSTDVQVHSNYALGALVSYRFMLTPSSALEVNYGITYQNTMKYVLPQFPNGVKVSVRTQEASAAYVRSFNYRKFNPF